MNKEQAKELLPFMQAVADGKTIQVCSLGKNWEDIEMDFGDSFIEKVDLYSFRVKPEPKKSWCRLYLMFEDGGFYVRAINNSIDEKTYPKTASFHSWITDRIEYEIPE